MFKNIIYTLLALTMITIFSGCATTPAPKEVKLIFPPHPEEPKIVYLTSYKGESDFKKSGFFQTFILGEAPLDTELRKPYGVAAHGDRIYVSDTSLGVVFVFDTREQKVSFIGHKGVGKLALPVGIAIDPDGLVFVADAVSKRVFGYDSEGELKVAIGGKDEFKNPAGIAINNKIRRLYIVDSYGHMVHVYSTEGKPLFTFGKRGHDDGEFNYPSNIAINERSENVYIVDTHNFKVQVFDKDGKFIKKFGQIGDMPGTFARPKGIGIDSEGNVYITDAAFDNFQVFNEKGELLLFIGGPGHDPGYFWLPAGAYVDEKDRIYVADSFNRRIQIFQYLSKKWKNENPGGIDKYLLK